MVKGRRKRAPSSSSVYSKSSAITGAVGSVVSPLRKESKLDIGGKGSRKSPETTRAHGRIDKSPVRITSFFRVQEQQENGVPVIKTPRGKQTTELLGETEHYNGGNIKVEKTEEDNLPINELFKTDETPVAVPCGNPPTPHRINMPNVQPDDADVKAPNEVVEKKRGVLVFSPIQGLGRKLGGRGRGRPKSKTTAGPGAIHSSSESKTNAKVTEYLPIRRSVRKCKKTVLEEKQRDLENKVVCQVEDGLEVRHFVGKGRGVVTTRKFVKGEFVVEYIGDLIDQVTAKKREAIYAQDQNTGCYMYYFQHRGQQYCVDATAETDKLGRLVNHCRNGNLVARVVEVCTVPHLVLTAKEDIPVGVEVTYDYGDRSREAIRNHPWLAL